jgi:ribose transport system ATP-binding protein
MSVTTHSLRVQHVSKTFGAQQALRDFQFDVRGGEVHALVGHNGSGKSTFVKVLAGYHRPDAGAWAAVDDEQFELGSSAAATAAGLRFVHQDLGLVEALGAVDNFFLGVPYPKRANHLIDWHAARDATAEAIGGLGFDFDPSLPVGALSPTQRTGLAIARALHGQGASGRVLVLDEPTAALPGPEVESLFEAIRTLKRQGIAIVYISHHLEEVFAIADRVTVLRDGKRVTTSAVSELDEARLVELIVGAAVGTAAGASRFERTGGPPALQLRGLSGRRIHGLDLDVAAGEIVGVAGVDGSGREVLAPAIFGALPRGGDVVVGGQQVPAPRPDVAVACAMGYVPADRTADGALVGMTVSQNLTVARLRTRLQGLLLDGRGEHDEAVSWSERLGLKPARPEAPVEILSGGNQQKVMVARWLRLAPRVLVLDEPTKGVDVAAVAAIWSLIAEAADSGTGVLVCSSDTEELALYCDRVIVLARGAVVGEFSGDDLIAETIDALALREPATGPAWAA